MIASDLQKKTRPPLAKTAGDLISEDSPESSEAELLALFDHAERAYRVALAALAEARSKHVGRMTPQSRAAANAMGLRAENDVNKLLDLKFGIEKRLAIVRGPGLSRFRKKSLEKKLDVDRADLEKFKRHQDEINRGGVVVDEQTRARLVRNIGLLEATISLGEQR